MQGILNILILCGCVFELMPTQLIRQCLNLKGTNYLYYNLINKHAFIVEIT